MTYYFFFFLLSRLIVWADCIFVAPLLQSDVCVEARAVYWSAMLSPLAAVTAPGSSIRVYFSSCGVDYVIVAD